jgi:hypothetical protein
MKGIIRCVDRFLRRALGVFEFCDRPDCVLRVRATLTVHAVTLPDRRVPAGAPVVELHMWNEHVPPIPPDGPDLAWAVRFQRRLMASFRELACQMRREPRFAGVRAVGGVTVLPLLSTGGRDRGLFERLGFVVCPHRGPLGRFGEFWENLYTWAIMWTYNQATLRGRGLLRLRRSEIWMGTGEFLRRYGEGG